MGFLKSIAARAKTRRKARRERRTERVVERRLGRKRRRIKRKATRGRITSEEAARLEQRLAPGGPAEQIIRERLKIPPGEFLRQAAALTKAENRERLEQAVALATNRYDGMLRSIAQTVRRIGEDPALLASLKKLASDAGDGRVPDAATLAALEEQPLIRSLRERAARGASPGFDTFSLAVAGDLALGVGGEVSLGAVWNAKEVAGFFAFGITAGAQAGGSGGLQFGLWRVSQIAVPEPPDEATAPTFQGAAWSFDFEAGYVVGIGLQLYVDPATVDLIGIGISISAAAEVEVNFGYGYTAVFGRRDTGSAR